MTVLTEEVADFNPIFEVGGCFVEVDGKILLLERQSHKPQGDTWGVPAGKLDGERDAETLRELAEETGLELTKADLSHVETIKVRFPDYDFIYHIFKTKLDRKPEVRINPAEHKNSIWEQPLRAPVMLSLMPDLDWCIDRVYGKGSE